MPITADGVTEIPTADGPIMSYHQHQSEFTSQRTGTAPLAFNNQQMSSEDFNVINGLQNTNLPK